MILACNHIHKEFSEEVILKDATFHINEQERTALVGINGAGKTTLLRIIVGELEADNGEVIQAKNTTFGYLPQQQGYHSDKTIYEELLAVKSDIIEMDAEIRTVEKRWRRQKGKNWNICLPVIIACKLLLKIAMAIHTKVRYSVSSTD